MRLATRTITLVAAVGLLAACAPSGGGASGDAGDDAQSIGLSVADTDAGPSLVGPNGMTLYVFTQDTDGTSTCTDECALAYRDTGENRRVAADRCASLHQRGNHGPISVGLQASVRVHGPGMQIVGEHHAVADEYALLERDPFANEGMARDLAVLTNGGVALNLDERPDSCARADAAPVHVDQIRMMDDNAFFENHT